MDVYALITQWDPMVAAYRDAGGLGFFWDANLRQIEELDAAEAAGKPISYKDIPDRLPYAIERDFGVGRSFMEASRYYYYFAPHLPPAIRDPADAFVDMLYPDDPADSDDLSADAGAPRDGNVAYAMRPATVRTALDRAAAVPWTAMAEIGERTVVPEMADSRYVSDYAMFADCVFYQQRDWLREAAAAGRGLVVILSF
jgi:hypothetical protein